MVLKANKKLTGTRTKLGLSATLLLGETEGHVVQSAHFQAIQNEFPESFWFIQFVILLYLSLFTLIPFCSPLHHQSLLHLSDSTLGISDREWKEVSDVNSVPQEFRI